MSRSRIVAGTLVLLVVLLSASVAGCLWAPELDRVRAEIEDQLPGVRFDREFAISLGPLSLGLARVIVRLVPDAAEAREYLAEIKRVKLAVYEVDGLPEEIDIRMPERLRILLEEDGWETAVKTNENGEAAWMLYRAERETIRDLYVVALDEDELVILRAGGRLDRLFVKALQERGGGPVWGPLETVLPDEHP